jgi:hypothetical protein
MRPEMILHLKTPSQAARVRRVASLFAGLGIGLSYLVMLVRGPGPTLPLDFDLTNPAETAGAEFCRFPDRIQLFQ